MNWPIVAFEELYAAPSRNGVTRPSRVRGDGFKMINMGELFAHDRIGDIEMERVKLSATELTTMLVEAGDLLFARQSLVLAGAGKCSIVTDVAEPTTFESHLIRVRLNREVADPLFFHYYFKSPSSGMKAIVTQGVQAGIRGSDLMRLPVSVPPLEVQKRIATSIAAYDDLIENNRKRIALLGEAARMLYREWFVHFRFPGHEHGAFVDGLPANWSRLPIRELADLYRGKSYSSAELIEVKGQPFVNLKCIDRNGGFRTSGLKRFRGEFKPQHRVDPGDIVIAVTDMTRDALVVARAARIPRSVGSEAIFSMDLVKLMPQPAVNRAWFYGLLRYSSFPMEVREKATGATVLHLLPRHIEAWAAPVPPPVLRNMYGDHHEALLAQIDSLELQNEKLAEARDLLLPRLMNGNLTV